MHTQGGQAFRKPLGTEQGLGSLQATEFVNHLEKTSGIVTTLGFCLEVNVKHLLVEALLEAGHF